MSDVLADRIERMERFVKRMNEVERDLTSPYVRPKDAATLILVDRDGRVPKVLLGKRHHGHKFMPGKFVFPGGRVDPADRRMPVARPLDPSTQAHLMKRLQRPSAAKARAFALAAIRETFEGHISGATRAGLFVKLDDTGADGFVPARTIGADYFRYHEDRHALIGARSGETHRLGDRVTVRLVEAAPVAGALRFELLSEGRYNGARRRRTRERAANAQSANRAQRERMRKR